MQLITPIKPLLAGLMLLAATQAHAKLTSYTAKDGVEVVYTSVSDVTWTKDANLLGSLIATQGFNTVVNNILAVSPTISNTPNFFSPTGTYTLTIGDFSSNGRVSWFGAMAFINYLNSTNYAGSNQWRLPSVFNNSSAGHNTSTNGTAAGDELSELFYRELGGTAGSNIPNTTKFDNEQAFLYWSGTEYAPWPGSVWSFDTGYGYQFGDLFKTSLSNAWAVSPGQITAVPEPESVAMLLLGLCLVGGLVRLQKSHEINKE